MGLDMHLSKKTYVQNWDHFPKEKINHITVKKNGKKHPTIDVKKITYIVEEIAYWRKANCIHDWFIKNCNEGEDKCIDIPVSREQLQELLDTCILVRDNSKLVDGKIKNGARFEKTPDGDFKEIPIIEDGKKIVDASVAKDLLPTAAGFFFGSTDYDEYYMDDILHTIEVLEAELKIDYHAVGVYEPDEYIYRPSW
jgi:hypothetical protein